MKELKNKNIKIVVKDCDIPFAKYIENCVRIHLTQIKFERRGK